MGCDGDLLSPESYGPSTIGAEKLNCCVRDGNRCGLLASTITGVWLVCLWKSDHRGFCEGVEVTKAKARGREAG